MIDLVMLRDRGEDEAADEIERLKTDLDGQADLIDEHCVTLDKQRAEIERLQDCNKARDHEIQGLYAEIEHLRAENKKLKVKLRHNVAYGAEK
jgi:hypothetical protein